MLDGNNLYCLRSTAPYLCLVGQLLKPKNKKMNRILIASIVLFLSIQNVSSQQNCLEKVTPIGVFRLSNDIWVPLEFLDTKYPCYSGDLNDQQSWIEYEMTVRAYTKEFGLFPQIAVGGDYFQNLTDYNNRVNVWFSVYPFYPQPIYTLNSQRDAEMFERWKSEWVFHFPEKANRLLSLEQMDQLENQGIGDSSNFVSVAIESGKVAGADECAGAVVLPVGAVCTFSGDYNNASATKSTGMVNPGCLFTTGTPKDIWFSFTMPSSGSVTVQTQAGGAPAMSDGTIAYYTGNCGTLIYGNCDDDSGPGLLPQITISEPAGTTIYLRYWGYNSSSGNTQFCVTDACPGFSAPTGVTTSVSPASASVSSNVTFTATGVVGGSCSGSWQYQFETLAGVIKQAWSASSSYTMNSVSQDTAMVVKVRCSTCTTSSITSSWMGFDYLTPSTNDACSNAIALTVGTYCDGAVKYRKRDETNDAGVPAPGCAGYVGGDVWFTAVAPASGNMTIDTDTIPNVTASNIGGNHLYDLGMAVYSGTCGSLSLVACDDDNSNNGANPKIILSGQTPGETVYIRVWDKNNDEEGAFTICATDGQSIDPGQNCLESYVICNNSTIDGNSDGFGVNELNASNKGCFETGAEHQSTWYVFSPTTSGTIGFELVPTNGTDDYDFAIWGPYPSGSTLASMCPPTVAPLRCSWYNGLGASNCYSGNCHNTGMIVGEVETSDDVWGSPIGTYKGFVAAITVAAGDVGKIYIMLIDNWSATTSPYTISWVLGGGCTLDCAVLPVVLGEIGHYCTDNSTVITWSTLTETNNDHFTVYRIDTEGTEFVEAVIDGSGNSNEQIDYQCVLHPENKEEAMYRLTQTDFNGKETELGYESAICNPRLSFAILNVVANKEKGTADVSFSTLLAGKYQIQIVDAKGEILDEKSMFVLPESTTSCHFANISFKEGVCFVRVISATNEAIVRKFPVL